MPPLISNPRRAIRRIGLALFEHVNPGDITIGHHWTGDRVKLHSYRHKGYWFHGRNRKRTVMEKLAALVGCGDCVFDLGGHIGYTALYLSSLVGTTGQVYVFEPSPENLTYLRQNVAHCVRKNIFVVDKAVSNQTGTTTLFAESRTGQNCTIVPDLQIGEHGTEYKPCRINTMTIDDFVEESGHRPHFMKIDVEGAELEVLCGMMETLRRFTPRLTVEINLNGSKVWQLLDGAGYRVYDEGGRAITNPESVEALSNLFAFHTSDAGAAGQFGKSF